MDKKRGVLGDAAERQIQEALCVFLDGGGDVRDISAIAERAVAMSIEYARGKKREMFENEFDRKMERLRRQFDADDPMLSALVAERDRLVAHAVRCGYAALFVTEVTNGTTRTTPIIRLGKPKD